MPDIGSTLREARMRSRIDIGEIETRTKIRAKYLRALENEEWDLLPGPVYVKSFLRTYGEFLGLDTRLLIEDFKRRYEDPSDHELAPIASIARERERPVRGPLLPPWAIVGGVLVAVVVALYLLGTGTSPRPPTTSTRAGNAHQRAHPSRQKPHAAVAPPSPSRPKAVTLRLVPTGTVYVCLVDGAGAKLIDERTFTAGAAVPPHTARKLLLTLGNASVQVKVNGRPVPVAASANAIRLLLGPNGVQHIPLSVPPTCP